MIHGIINVYKEKGFTSHDVVAKLRGIVGQRKIGHTGTLDPDAVGVLPVCCGRATKLCDLLTDKDKVYETVLLLGVDTDTQDVSGEVLMSKETSGLTEKEVRAAVLSFEGDYDQIPPMYSALKVGGKKLYELAREGKTVERKARRVQIFDLEILAIDLPRVKIRVHCSKGTYIRTLCHDIGEKLGCGGCMEKLVRTKVSRFSIEEAYTLSQIEGMKEKGELENILLPIDRMFEEYKKVVVMGKWKTLIYNGNPFPKKAVLHEADAEDQEQVRVYDQEGRFIGLYRYRASSKDYTIVKMFFDQESLRKG